VHEFYAEVPVQMVMDGGFHEFGIFFDRVSKMSRIVSVTDIRMGDPRDVGPEVDLNTSGRIVTFRFLTEEEIKKNADKGKGGAPAAGGGGE
jgi:type IV pilus assembly protein PilO